MALSTSSALQLSSWMDKQADWRFSWDRRLFALNQQTISYREKIHLPDKKAGRVTYLEPKLAQPRCFRVRVDSGEAWTIRADDDATYKQWITALTAVLTRLEEGEASTEGGKWIDATVEKRSYWTHTWKPRYIRLNLADGSLQHSTGAEQPIKGKTSVLSADLVMSCERRNEVAFGTASGDDFHARFASSDEAATWVAEVERLLAATSGCRWARLAIQKADPILGAASNALGFDRVSHCTYVLPGTDHVFVWGGRSSKGFATTDANVESLAPLSYAASGALASTDVFHTRFSGDLAANTINIAPFEETTNAKVRPSAREGSASVCVGTTWLIYGGRAPGLGLGSILADVWSISFESLVSRTEANTPLRWNRLAEDKSNSAAMGERSLPPLAFHGGLSLTVPSAEGHPLQMVLFCGGTNDGASAADSCWLYDPATGAATEALPMDVPRAQHALSVLPTSQEVIAIGGVRALGTSGGSLSLVMPVASIRNPVTGRWGELRLTPIGRPMPPLPYPSCAVISSASGQSDTCLMVYGGAGDCRNLPELAMLGVRATYDHGSRDGFVEVVAALGTAPTVPVGVSLATFGRYVYVLGGDGMHRLLTSTIPRQSSVPTGEDVPNELPAGSLYACGSL